MQIAGKSYEMYGETMIINDIWYIVFLKDNYMNDRKLNPVFPGVICSR